MKASLSPVIITVAALLGLLSIVKLKNLQLKHLLQLALNAENNEEFKKYYQTSLIDINDSDKNGWTCIIYAAKEGNTELVDYLINNLKASANPLKPLTHTAMRGAALAGHLDIIKILVEDGKGNVSTPSDGNRTPLMGAAMNNYIDIVKYLIANNVELNTVNTFGETALDVAKWKKNDEIVKLLIDAGAK